MMVLDRTDKIALSAAVAGHLLLFAALSVNLFAKPPRSFDNPPMEVDLIAESAITSAAPEISPAPPASRLAAEAGPVEDATIAEAEPAVQPRIEPVPTPTPRIERPAPAPRPSPKAAPKPAPPARATPAPAPAPKATRSVRPTGNLKGVLDGIGKEASASKSNAAPAQSVGEIKRSIKVSISAEVTPRWKSCKVSGIDVELLRTTVIFNLTRSGGLAGISSANTTGENDSNRPQKARFEECALRAIQLAAPFDLPVENYDHWKTYKLEFNYEGTE